MNPSFENVTIANLQCSWYTSQAQFNNAIDDWTVPTGGSTDIFNTALGTGCYCSPFSTNGSSPGQQAPRTGNGFVNIVTYGDGGCDPWREYIQGELTTPLVAGQTYEVKFYVSLGDKMSVGTDNIGVKFATAPYNQGSNCPYYTTPDLNYTGAPIMDKNNWTEISFCFTPSQSGLSDFIIGNFLDDASTNTQPASGSTSKTTIRYFVEDVSIENITTSGNPGSNGTVSVCPSDPSIDLFNSLGGTPDATGTWSGPSTLSGGHLGTFDPLTDATGTYTYQVSGSAPCATSGGASATVTVSVGSANATITATGPFCVDDASVNLTGADPGGTWSGTGITDPGNGTFDPNTAGAGTHTITYTISGSCSASDNIDIVVNSLPDATISPAGPFCTSDASLNLTAATAGGTWSGTGITNAGNGTFDPNVAGAGTHTITYNVGTSCTSSDTYDIVVNEDADATITAAGPFCLNDASVNLTGADPGGTWSGTGITDPGNGTFDPNTAGAGTHTITYNVGTLCPVSDSYDITVQPLDDASINSVGPLCQNTTTTILTAATTPGSWSGTGITNTSNGVFDPNQAGAGTHTITYTTNDVCPNSNTIDIEVLPKLSIAAFQDQSICVGETVNITTTASGGDGNYSYSWTDNSGVSVGNNSSLNVSPNSTTTYTVNLTDGCSTPAASASAIITVNDLPNININADNFSGCAPLKVNFVNTSLVSGSNCEWTINNTLYSTCSPTHTFNQSGCYDISLKVEENGCTDTKTIQDMICVDDTAVADFNYSPKEVNILDTEVKFTNNSINADSYQWLFGDNGLDQAVNPTYEFPKEAGTYNTCLIAKTNLGCNDTTCSNIFINDKQLFFVPNAFTPDGDEHNDVFQPVFTSGYDPYNFHLMIFNRWGEVVWESYNANASWDGRYADGSIVPDGVYVWKIEFKTTQTDKRIKTQGHVNVLR